jgi:hypothetical protein
MISAAQLTESESEDLWLDRATFIEMVRAGNHALLVRELRFGMIADQAMWDLAADIIEGKLKRPAHRIKAVDQQNKRINVVDFHFARPAGRTVVGAGAAPPPSAPQPDEFESDDLWLDHAAVIEKIRAGDFPLLVRLLRFGKFADQKILDLAADIIESKLKRPAHRIKTVDQQNRHIHIAAVFHFKKRAGTPYKKARYQTAKECRCTERTVETAASAYEIVVAGDRPAPIAKTVT